MENADSPEEHRERDNLRTRAARIWPKRWAATYELPERAGKASRRALRQELAVFEAWGVIPRGSRAGAGCSGDTRTGEPAGPSRVEASHAMD